jgi:uncharacterized protein (TIGR02145 family)
MDLPNSNGFFQGYVENSGKKSVVFVDQYKDILALRGTSWMPKTHSAKIAENMDFSLEIAVQLKRLDGNTGGAQIKLYSDETKKNVLIFSLQEYKKEPYDTATASVVDKAIYLTAKTAFKNVSVIGTVGGVAVEKSLKYYGMDYSKFNTLKIIKKSRIIELYVNDVQLGIVELLADFALNQVTLDKEASHDVFYDYIKVDQIEYNKEDRLSYNGEWLEGLFQGQGELLYNGGIITGQFSGGNLNGEGKAVFKNYTYSGNFKNGLPEGKGNIVTPDYEYNGDVTNWSPNGYGKKVFKKQFLEDGNDELLIFNQRPYYLGYFKDGTMSGKGTLHYRNGDSLNGNWNNDLFTGKGKLKLKDGSIYDGDWLNGKKHGKGILANSDGTVLQGDFANDGFYGLAKLKLDDGGIFEGQLVNGKPSGPGTIIYANGGKLIGTMTESGFNGKGKLITTSVDSENNTKNEITYNGEFKDGKYSGYGELKEIMEFYEDEYVLTYIGNFNNGLKHGSGEYTSDGPERSIHYVGEFWEDAFNGKGTLDDYTNECSFKYTGNFKNGSPSGNGKLDVITVGNCYDWDSNLKSFEGSFSDGLPDGTGTIIFSNGTKIYGKMKMGEYLVPFEPKKTTIESQVWMSENLAIIKFNNGDPIPEAKTALEWEQAGEKKQPAFCYYNNDPSTVKKYGVLYNYYAVKDPRGLAPEGWRLPNPTDVSTLKQFLEKELIQVEKEIEEKIKMGIDITSLNYKRESMSKPGSEFLGGIHLLPKTSKGTNKYGFNLNEAVERKEFGDFSSTYQFIFWANMVRNSEPVPLIINHSGVNNECIDYSELGSNFWRRKNYYPSEDPRVGYPVRLIKQ